MSNHRMKIENKLNRKWNGICRELLNISDDEFRGEDGTTLKREYGETPRGNPMNGRWVLRGPGGELIDFDRSLNDLVSHYDLNLLEIK